jgi:hypothetical protein
MSDHKREVAQAAGPRPTQRHQTTLAATYFRACAASQAMSAAPSAPRYSAWGRT